MRSVNENESNNYFCKKHKNVGEQIISIGIFRKGVFQKFDFCGVCHFEMIKNNCRTVKLKEEI